MKIITEQRGKLKNKKVLLRLDLNVPLVGGKMIDNFKVEKILSTISFLKKEGAKIIIISHIGRDGSESLLPVCEYMRKFFEVLFIEDIFGDGGVKVLSGMQAGDIVMLENLRQFKKEVENDINFTKKLASFGEIYVNEAFAVSHRKHSSIVGLPVLMESYFGPEFVSEVQELKTVSKANSPKIFILGGNKLKTKIPFIERFLSEVDFLFIGGALANDVFRSKGLEVGKSLVSKEDFELDMLLYNKKIILPIDVIVENDQGIFIRKPDKVSKVDKIVDAGPETSVLLDDLVSKSKFVLWNGPLGDYPRGFSDATFNLIRTITDSKVESIVGGGDTEHCISKVGLEEKFDFISTGGGAMLEFVAEGTLVGIEAIKGKV